MVPAPMAMAAEAPKAWSILRIISPAKWAGTAASRTLTTVKISRDRRYSGLRPFQSAYVDHTSGYQPKSLASTLAHVGMGG